MYSPKIAEELIPALYRISKAEGKPMTHIVNGILKGAVSKMKTVVKEDSENNHQKKGGERL